MEQLLVGRGLRWGLLHLLCRWLEWLLLRCMCLLCWQLGSKWLLWLL